MNKPAKIILRLLISPFLLCIILVKYNYAALKHAFLAIKYGGEWTSFIETLNQALRIHDVSGRSEQLKAFLEWADGQWLQMPGNWQQMIDEYEASR